MTRRCRSLLLPRAARDTSPRVLRRWRSGRVGRRPAIVMLLLILLLAGCQADATLRIDVEPDGGGVVTVGLNLDPEAAARTVAFESKPLIDDLLATGWTVTGLDPQPDGWYRIEASKGFSRADQLPGLIEEVAGRDGPLRGFRLERDTAFAERSWTLTGTVDLRGGLAAFGDEDLTRALGGLPLGHDEAALEASLGRPLESLVNLQVSAYLPGSVEQTNGTVAPAPPRGRPSTTTTTLATTAPAAGGAPTSAPARRPPDVRPVTWTASFADPTPLELTATSTSSQLTPKLWRWLAIAAAVVGVCALVYQGAFALLEGQRERRRARRRRPGPVGVTLAEPVPEPVSEGLGSVSRVDDEQVPTGPTPVDGDGPPSRPPAAVWSPGGTALGAVRTGGPPGAVAGGGLRLLVLETAGVLFDVVDPVNELLVPHVRSRGSSLAAAQVDDWYVARVVGGLAPADFWSGLGIVGDPMLLDDTYARRYELSPDIVDFLANAGERGLEVAALGDEVPEWIGVFRQRHRLDAVIGAWISSGEVGVRPPHPALLRAAWRATGFAPEHALVIARSLPLLDVAAAQGARTVQYAPEDDPAGSVHPVLRSFGRVST